MIKRIIVSLGLVLTISTFALSPSAGAVDIWGGKACSNTSADLCQKKDDTDTTSLTQSVINLILYIAGLMSIIMIIVAGIMYATAHGVPDKVANAKRTLIYAVVGLLISVLSVAIVRYVYDTILASNFSGQQVAVIEQNSKGDNYETHK